MRAATMAAAALVPGDHVCWVFGDDDGYADALTGLIDGGLRDHQRIIHYLDGASLLPDLDERLAARGLPVAAARARGQLQSEPIDTAQPFDPHGWGRSLAGLVDEARRDGYTGVRFAGDMSWTRGHLPDDDLVGYESHVNTVYATTASLGLCLYDARRFTPALLADISRVHPDTAAGDLDGDRPMFRVAVTGSGVRLAGELDASNGGCLAAVLDGLPAVQGSPLVVDATALAFADVSAVSALVRAAHTAPAGLRILGARPALRRVVELCGPAPVAFG